MARHSHYQRFSFIISGRFKIIAQSLTCLTSFILKEVCVGSYEITWNSYVILESLLDWVIVGFRNAESFTLTILNWWMTRMSFSILLAHRLRWWPHKIFIVIWRILSDPNRCTSSYLLALTVMRTWSQSLRILPSCYIFICLPATYIRSHSKILRDWSLIKLSIFFRNYWKCWHFSFQLIVRRHRHGKGLFLCWWQFILIQEMRILIILRLICITSLIDFVAIDLRISSIYFLWSWILTTTYCWIQINCIVRIANAEENLPCARSIDCFLILLRRLCLIVPFKFFIPQHAALSPKLLI